jgi:hypothetical protein
MERKFNFCLCHFLLLLDTFGELATVHCIRQSLGKEIEDDALQLSPHNNVTLSLELPKY